MMRTLWNIGAAVLKKQQERINPPVGQYCFLRDHTGALALFWRWSKVEPWNHYSLHPFWNESRIQSNSINLALGSLFPNTPTHTPWLALMRMLKHRGWELVDLRIKWNVQEVRDESHP